MNDITELIIENEGLIYKIINKYRNYFEIEDLYQVAVMGIIKASKNYNSEFGSKFTSYAYPFILGEVIKYINEYRSIKVNKETAKLYSKILKAYEILSQKLMKIPSNYELSLFLEIDEKIIDEVLVSYFVAPRSYTAENMCEINTHGSNVIEEDSSEIFTDSADLEVLPSAVMLINDVWCIQFAASNFSPFALVIYKDNLMDVSSEAAAEAGTSAGTFNTGLLLFTALPDIMPGEKKTKFVVSRKKYYRIKK